jgi:hypothetical protein
MQIAQRVYALAQQQNNPALLVGAYRALAGTLYHLGEFEAARQHARRGVQLWRSGCVPAPVEEVHAPAVLCLCYEALAEWHFGEIALCRASIAEAISVATELSDTHALALALFHAASLGHFDGDPAEVERLTADLIEVSTRQDFALWLTAAEILRGWARSTSGDAAGGLVCIEEGIRDYRAAGAMAGERLLPAYSLRCAAIRSAQPGLLFTWETTELSRRLRKSRRMRALAQRSYN